MEVMIGALTVFLVALARFNVPPPAKLSLPPEAPRILGLLRQLAQWKAEPDSNILPPPRADTTLFRFWLYRTAYGVIGVVVYLVVYEVPGVLQGVQMVVNLAGLEDPFMLKGATPFMLAIVVLLLPVLPVFKGAEVSIRRALYLRALIPAEQLRLQARLKKATYEVKDDVLQKVRETLEAEGFDRSDIVYEATPTTRSLWTKAALLMEHSERWQQEKKYQTAFAVLKESESNKRSAVVVREAYDALKGDAATCFTELRDHPDQRETVSRDARFRRDCAALLKMMYALLSRVSLHSHYSDRDRVTYMGQIGFQLRRRVGGPIPDPDETLWLGIILGFAVILPMWLWARVGVVGAVMVASIFFTAVVTPILIAAENLQFAMKRGDRIPAIAFPVVSGLVAAVLGIMINLCVWSIIEGTDGSLSINIRDGWSRFRAGAYLFYFLVFLVAFLIAVRMRSGAYPDISKLKGYARYQEWGNLWDAAVFSGCTILLMALYIKPRLVELRPERFLDNDWHLVIIPAIMTFVIGFFVPTWYRANKLRMEKEDGESRHD